MNANSKEQLVEQFRVYLEASDGEIADNVDDGSDASTTDLFSLYAELAALKNEVRLESRQLKNALEKFSALFDSLQHSNDRLTRDLDALRAANTLVLRDAENKLLLEIIDLRDRLDAGLSVAQGYRARGLARFSAAPARFVASLSDGMAISLRRVDELLARYQVQAVAAVGRRLDPGTMHATGVENQADQPEGSVIAEVRKGYTRNDEPLRLAEVIVNKQPQHDR